MHGVVKEKKTEAQLKETADKISVYVRVAKAILQNVRQRQRQRQRTRRLRSDAKGVLIGCVYSCAVVCRVCCCAYRKRRACIVRVPWWRARKCVA